VPCSFRRQTKVQDRNQKFISEVFFPSPPTPLLFLFSLFSFPLPTFFPPRNGPSSISATTVGTRGNWSPNFQVGDQQCIAPNFLAVVFKKQEISQQVVTRRIQDLASEFSKFFGDDNPEPSQREGATPNLGPPQLFSRGCAPAFKSS